MEENGTKNETKRVIIIDTDIGFDSDDAGALALANVHCNENRVTISGMTHCVAGGDGVKVIDAINRYYGNEFPIGEARFSRADPRNYRPFVRRIAEKYGCGISARSAVETMKAALDESEEKTVTFVGIGQMNDFAALVERYPELVREKAARFVIMAGCFEEYDAVYTDKNGYLFEAEFNVALDVESARSFVGTNDVEIDFIDYAQGVDVYTGRAFRRDADSPLYEAYRDCKDFVNLSWDLLAVEYACGTSADMFTEGQWGTVSIDEKGKTTFREGSGKHRLIKLAVSPEVAAERLEKILSEGIIRPKPSLSHKT